MYVSYVFNPFGNGDAIWCQYATGVDAFSDVEIDKQITNSNVESIKNINLADMKIFLIIL